MKHALYSSLSPQFISIFQHLVGNVFWKCPFRANVSLILNAWSFLFNTDSNEFACRGCVANNRLQISDRLFCSDYIVTIFHCSCNKSLAYTQCVHVCRPSESEKERRRQRERDRISAKMWEKHWTFKNCNKRHIYLFLLQETRLKEHTLRIQFFSDCRLI